MRSNSSGASSRRSTGRRSAVRPTTRASSWPSGSTSSRSRICRRYPTFPSARTWNGRISGTTGCAARPPTFSSSISAIRTPFRYRWRSRLFYFPLTVRGALIFRLLRRGESLVLSVVDCEVVFCDGMNGVRRLGLFSGTLIDFRIAGPTGIY